MGIATMRALFGHVWRISTGGHHVLIARAHDVSPTDATPRLCAAELSGRLPEWLADRRARHVLADVAHHLGIHHGTTRRALEDGLRDAFRRGRLVALRPARARVVQMLTTESVDAPSEGGPLDYELLLKIQCEVTGFALPRALFAVFDDKGRQVHRGQADVKGEARVDVGLPGEYTMLVFAERVEGAALLVVGADGVPIANAEIKLEDSEGEAQLRVTRGDGIARIPDAASGIAKVTVGAEIVSVYLHPRQSEVHVVRIPKFFTEIDSDPYACHDEPAAKDAPAPDPKPKANAAAAGGGAANTPKLPDPDPAIDALNLAHDADVAARELKKTNPNVVFTSGRRSVGDQVHAMAVNVAKEIQKSGKRDWIRVTYVKDGPHKKLQEWIDDNADATTTAELAKGLTETVDGMTDAEKMKLSKHITGRAFDIQPGTAKEEDVNALPGLKQFLKKEGNLVRWHCQF